MDVNYQDAINSDQATTKDKPTPPLSLKEAKREKRKRARLRLWRMRIKRHRVAIGVVIVVLVAVIALILVGYQFNWTGFNNQIGPQLKPNQQYRPEKTLWDWLQLLIAPIAISLIGLLFTRGQQLRDQKRERQQKKRDQLLADQRAKTEHEIATDNQREAALQDYIDKMSELLLKENLRGSDDNAEVRKIARVRTLTVLPRLDKERKIRVLEFIQESGLEPILDLHAEQLNVFTTFELQLIRKLAFDESFLLHGKSDISNLYYKELGRLLVKEYIVRRVGRTISSLDIQLQKGKTVDVKDYFEITESGRDLMMLITRFESKPFKSATMPDGSIHS